MSQEAPNSEDGSPSVGAKASFACAARQCGAAMRTAMTIPAVTPRHGSRVGSVVAPAKASAKPPIGAARARPA